VSQPVPYISTDLDLLATTRWQVKDVSWVLLEALTVCI
jgi:hypothetical protein